MISESRRYFAEDFASTGEQERLGVLAGNYDSDTFRLLKDCGVALGWRCAEVGPGSGTVAAWLADAVGAAGSIVAFDIDTSHLDHLGNRSNVVVHQHDIVAEPIGDASFDLVHTRLVIEHLPSRSACSRCWRRPHARAASSSSSARTCSPRRPPISPIPEVVPSTSS